MKRAAARETVVVAPVVVEPVEVQVPLLAIEVEVRHAGIAVAVAQKYAGYRPYHHPSSTLRVESNFAPLAH